MNLAASPNICAAGRVRSRVDPWQLITQALSALERWSQRGCTND